MADRLLDLSSKTARKTIRIDGIDYQVRAVNDLTMADHQQIEITWPRIAGLVTKATAGTATKPEALELRALLRKACRMALLAPETVIRAQGDLNLTLIFDAFIKLLSPSLLAARAQLLGVRPGAPLPAGTNSFLASRASTASARRSGSATSRRA